MWSTARAEKSADYILGIESSYSASEEKNHCGSDQRSSGS